MMHSVDVVRTHEILARYRPIAPRPPMLENPATSSETQPTAPPRVPGRTPRTRKRRGSNCFSFSFSSQKRCRTYVPVLPLPLDGGSSCHQAALAFTRGFPVLPFLMGGGGGKLTFSLLPCSPREDAEIEESLHLNTNPMVAPAMKALQEKDLLGSMQKVAATTTAIIVPQPVRPVGSTISVDGIVESTSTARTSVPRRTTKDVEEEVESEALPVVVSDVGNRVRLANSAYKEMVGQPECPWLGSMVGASRRIGGEVMLELHERSAVPASFSCSVRIEWACNGEKRSVSSTCDVERLSCESKDYVLAWRFHTGGEAAAGSVENCDA